MLKKLRTPILNDLRWMHLYQCAPTLKYRIVLITYSYHHVEQKGSFPSAGIEIYLMENQKVFLLFERQLDSREVLVMGIYTDKELALEKKADCEKYHEQEFGEKIVLELLPVDVNTDTWLSDSGPATWSMSNLAGRD